MIPYDKDQSLEKFPEESFPLVPFIFLPGISFTQPIIVFAWCVLVFVKLHHL